MGELFTRFYKMLNKSIKTKLIIIRTYIIWHIHYKLSSIFWLYLLHGRRSYQVNIFIERNNFSMYQLCKMMLRSPQRNYRFWYTMKSTRHHKYWKSLFENGVNLLSLLLASSKLLKEIHCECWCNLDAGSVKYFASSIW